jgi:hypothetical protein
LGFGSRAAAVPYRESIEAALEDGKPEVIVDFTATEATQSFVDELIGVLVLSHGPDVLRSVKFRGCSDDLKAIIRFVVSDRAEQYKGGFTPSGFYPAI